MQRTLILERQNQIDLAKGAVQKEQFYIAKAQEIVSGLDNRLDDALASEETEFVEKYGNLILSKEKIIVVKTKLIVAKEEFIALSEKKIGDVNEHLSELNLKLQKFEANQNGWWPWRPQKKDAAASAGGAVVGAVAAQPIAMTAINVVGFGSNGVVAGSFAAAAQTPFTAGGSIFSMLQSAGAVGTFAASTTIILGAFGALVG